MADRFIQVVGVDGATTLKRLQDMGNGTWAEVVALGADPTINIGKIEVLGDDGAVVIGSAGDAAAQSGTWTAMWKYIASKIAFVYGAGTAATAQRTTLASDDPAVSVLGAASGAKVITDANGTIQQYLRGLVTFYANALGAGTAAAAERVTLASDDPIFSNTLGVSQKVATSSVTITRPADANAYAANDAFANSTSAPTTGGFTLANAARAAGGSGVITDAVISASAGTDYQGEIWLFDQAVTATNDNAALSVADADILNLVGVIPFRTNDVNAANSISYVTGLNIGFTCVGSANLRFLVKILNTPTPGNAEVLSVRIKVQN